MRVVLVHDYLNQYGGAEKVLEAFIEIFPDAPIYTLIYNKNKIGNIIPGKNIRASFLQKIPLVKSHHRFFPPLMPLAIEKFDLSAYDLVVSDSASFAKGVLTSPEALHICYCHTPPRYAWDDSQKYIREFPMPSLSKLFIPFFMNYIRIWDKEAASRVDKFIANSNFVAQRIKKYYKRDAEIIYPPVDTKYFFPGDPARSLAATSGVSPAKDGASYFLMVGRLLPYKRFDVAIEAFNKLELPLKIIGDGPDKKKLKKMANWNIEFLGELNSDKLREYYRNCKALIFPQEEDFGIVALESMSCGKPVIAYRGGGAMESVKNNETGIFFNEQTIDSLVGAVKIFNQKNFDPLKIREHAKKFDKEIFKKKIKDFINKSYENHRDRY